MNIVILNGSPRKEGNCSILLKRIKQGFMGISSYHNIDFIDLDNHSLKPCRACEVCETTSGKCVIKDDTNGIIAKVLDADVLILGSPVYWWGISSQLKIIIDKFYCFTGIREKIKPKKIGAVTVGAEPLGEKQYKLIRDQYECIFNYLGWQIVFHKSVSAYKKGEVLSDTTLLDSCSQKAKLF